MAKRRRSYARRAYRAFRRRFHRPKTIAIIPTIAGIAPTAMAFQKTGGIEGIMSQPANFLVEALYENTGVAVTTGGGYQGFNPGILMRNVTMWGGAYVTHMLMNRLGVNRSIRKIPVVGKYISL